MRLNIFNRNRKNVTPPFWEAYLRHFQKKEKHVAFDNNTRFIVFDTETTGFHPKKDALLSIGAVGITGRMIRIADRFEAFVNYPEQQFTKKNKASISVHGIIPEHPDGQPLENVLASFIDYIGNSILVGQNIGFDIEVINQKLKLIGISGKLKNPVLDTALLGMRLDGIRHPAHARSGKYTLDALCQRFNIPLHDRHNAAGDAYITALLFLLLSKKLQDKKVNIQRELLGKRL